MSLSFNLCKIVKQLKAFLPWAERWRAAETRRGEAGASWFRKKNTQMTRLPVVRCHVSSPVWRYQAVPVALHLKRTLTGYCSIRRMVEMYPPSLLTGRSGGRSASLWEVRREGPLLLPSLHSPTALISQLQQPKLCTVGGRSLGHAEINKDHPTFLS